MIIFSFFSNVWFIVTCVAKGYIPMYIVSEEGLYQQYGPISGYIYTFLVENMSY